MNLHVQKLGRVSTFDERQEHILQLNGKQDLQNVRSSS